MTIVRLGRDGAGRDRFVVRAGRQYRGFTLPAGATRAAVVVSARLALRTTG